MKKLLLLLLILMMTILFPATRITGNCAFAEKIDFVSISLEDLTQLQQNVEYEMNVRKASLFYEGEYLVGMDIPAGTYVVKSSNQASIYLFASEDEFKKYNPIIGYTIEKDRIRRLTLEDGMYLWAGDSCIIQQVPSMLFPVIGQTENNAFSEEIALKSMSPEDFILIDMSLEDLAMLQKRVESEMSVRNVLRIPQGMYFVGKDIRADAYILTAISTTMEGLDYMLVLVYQEDNYVRHEYLYKGELNVGEQCQVRLEDGQRLEIYLGTCAIQQVSSMFFAP